MQRYLNHLLADLETATRNAPVASSYRFLSPFEEDDDPDMTTYQVRYLRLHEIFDLEAGVFPPSERLTKTQLTILLSAIEKLWRAWSIQWDCPPRLTARRRYKIMIERMERDTVRYSYEFGTRINFCDKREEGHCPFGDKSQCWCEELDACAHHDLEIWEIARDLEDAGQPQDTPLDEFRRWQEQQKPEGAPWELFDSPGEDWKALTRDEDSFNWLFFYDPQRSRDLSKEIPEPTPEDFEDFDWHSEADDELDELPF